MLYNTDFYFGIIIMKLNIFYKIILLLFVALSVASCQTIREQFKDPEVKFSSLSVENISLDFANIFTKLASNPLSFMSLKNDIKKASADLVFNLDIKNPNSFALPLENFDYEIFIGNDAKDSLTKGSLSGQGEVPANGNKTIAVPFNLAYSKIIPLLKNFSFKDTKSLQNVFKNPISYKLVGTGRFGAVESLGFKGVPIPIEKKGVLQFPLKKGKM
ncbi:MAG: hypothetical protein DRQ51_05845 [Gammaproteobacteria bacterium]|nr:MAG: hypothetical protein DRQ51_05845 [Gammaproteobacteria bacterium]